MVAYDAGGPAVWSVSQRDDFPAALTLTAAEVDELRRAAAVGPIDPADLRRVLEEHERVQRERAELVAILDRLAPAWRELREVLNELKWVLEP